MSQNYLIQNSLSGKCPTGFIFLGIHFGKCCYDKDDQVLAIFQTSAVQWQCAVSYTGKLHW